MLIAIIAAVAAGLCFAAAGVLQQRVASTRPERESLSARLLVDLARRPVWLAGIGLAVLSYGFQSLALAFGPLALVQPLIVTELLFAIPISIRLHKLHLSWREWVGAASVAGGLAIAIAASQPHGGDPLPPWLNWVIALGSVGVLAAAAVLIGRQIKGPVRASLFAFAAAAILGVQSALLKASVALFKQGIVTALASWEVYAMAAASIGGLLFVQSAYQAGPLAASMPVIDATEPTVAIVIGVVLFDEIVSTGMLNLVGTGIGLVLLFGGIVLLDTSPVVHRLQRVERKQRDTRDSPVPS